jgi:hypothetical protein
MAAVVALAVGVVLFGSGGATRVAASPQAGVATGSVSLDCDPGTAGVQSSCLFSTGTTSVDVAVVFTNNSGSPQTVGSFQFNVVANQSIFNPLNGVNTNLNAKPDFNETGMTGTGWSCNPPAPNKDTNANPAIADSLLSCFDGSADGPSVANGASVVLATVHYSSIDGVGAFTTHDVVVTDNGGFELLSCNPQILTTTGVCNDTSIQIGANTPTPTSTPTITPTPADTSTPAPAGTATPEGYKSVTPTGTPATSTPVPGSETAVATATDTAVVPPPVAPPPSGDAGAGGTRPIRLPDTGGGKASTDWSAMSIIVLAALAAGALAGGLYLGVAQLASVRREDGED